MRRYAQNTAEHARKRHTCMCKVSIHVRAHFCFVCMHMCTDLYQILVVHYSIMSLRFNFYKDLIFHLRYVCKIERCGFFGLSTIRKIQVLIDLNSVRNYFCAFKLSVQTFSIAFLREVIQTKKKVPKSGKST